jgi:4-amino-4-deoxy-L-arabinose transferase-like glycosyltransferase
MLSLPRLNEKNIERREWCVRLAIALIFIGAALNVIYLWNHCPLELTEDESHYWEWSRHLDYGYYSKPPGIAWVIAAATAVGRWCGMTMPTMPLVRMPAILFSIGSGLITFFFARRIWRDDRAGLMAIVLSGALPVFSVGSLLITIDSPMYFFWAASVFCLWRFLDRDDNRDGTTTAQRPNGPRREDQAAESPGIVSLGVADASKGRSGREPIATRGSLRWLYLAAVCVSLGMLFKQILIVIPLAAAVCAFFDRSIRSALATWHSLIAIFIALSSQMLVVIWNAQHDWVTFRHVGGQVGGTTAGTHGWTPLQLVAGPPEYVGTQLGLLAGIMGLLLAAAVWEAIRRLRGRGPIVKASGQPALLPIARSALVYLFVFAGGLWLACLIQSFWKKPEPNWPAPSYFAGIVLLAGVASFFWNRRDIRGHTAWRNWIVAAVIWGVVLLAIGENFQIFYPRIVHGSFEQYQKQLKLDPAYRLRGWQGRAFAVSEVVRSMQQRSGHAPLVIANRYDTSSSLAFYLPGQPFVYCIGSWLGNRMTQYDIWPGLDQTNPTNGQWIHEGEDAVYVGEPADAAVLRRIFSRVEGPLVLPAFYHAVEVRQVTVFRCYNFQHMPPRPAGTSF